MRFIPTENQARRQLSFNKNNGIDGQNSIDREEQEACEQIEDEKQMEMSDGFEGNRSPMTVRQIKIELGTYAMSHRESITGGYRPSHVRTGSNHFDFAQAKKHLLALKRHTTE